MRLNHPTEDELRSNFEEELASVRSGGGLSSDTGLDSDTESALWDIARAYPDGSEALVAAARQAFAGQLDGSNSAARRARMERMVDEYRRDARKSGD
ncbi:hypothetical protein [Nocardia blacklockiae]|uniref:hypothetical protein n=1 Tax=Nocardia blacklockiae TaxID=480036 RepID=UPI001894C5B1|nr:hypothetical protein [Nocardia blacklockiae]MBF6171414.1 hypothetical protein [Nocardia blacklockiae]